MATHQHHQIIPAGKKDNAYITPDKYQAMYEESMSNPDLFWAKQADRIDWFAKWDTVQNTSLDKDNLKIRWFEGGKLNVCHNAVDRHLETSGNKTAIIWEGDDPSESKDITYKELHAEVSRFANVLKKMGVKKGDVVTIYLPMIPEAAYAMLACARIGAVHSVVFAGFSPEALHGRVEDCNSKLVITADEGLRGSKKVPLKDNVDKALKLVPDAKVLLINRTGAPVAINKCDTLYSEIKDTVPLTCECEVMDAEDPLFILYTSGSTGKPKGIRHTTGGYIVYTSLTHQLVFNYEEEDVYWCTADIGWITGHSYLVYGPLANGATTLMFEGVPTYPDASRMWQIVDKHQVNIFYTAPTAIRMLMGHGDEFVTRTDRNSLKILGTVGEPINEEAWLWYYENVGNSKCQIVDTWWQTETGGFMITPFPYATPAKPGSATLPFFGIEPVIVDNDGRILEGEAEGNLCIKNSWPSQARGIHGNEERFINAYFSRFPGMYFTGDGCRRDSDGYYWITGRVDDVINVSGHRIGTAEIENVLDYHDAVVESAVVGYEHDIKGQGIYAFVILKNGVNVSEAIENDLVQLVRSEISPIVTPDFVQFSSGLPKTRSGKIMRRILRKIANDEVENFGDTRTLVNPEVVDELVRKRLNTHKEDLLKAYSMNQHGLKQRREWVVSE